MPDVKPIIHTPYPFDMEISILFNTKTGMSEMKIKNVLRDPKMQFRPLQIAGLLSEHVTSLLRQAIGGKVDVTPIKEEPTNAT